MMFPPNNRCINDSHLIAEHRNNYFVEIGPKIASKISPCNSKYQDCLSDPNPSSMFFAPVTEHELFSVVSDLPSKKSAGYDSVNSITIKQVISSISKPLTFIMNLSLCTGDVPNIFKIARVIPIFKSGDPQQVNNYRPISILSLFSKILEHIVYFRTSQLIRFTIRVQREIFHISCYFTANS